MRQRRITPFTRVFIFQNIHILRSAHVVFQSIRHIGRPHWAPLHRNTFGGFVFPDPADSKTVGLDDLLCNFHGRFQFFALETIDEEFRQFGIRFGHDGHHQIKFFFLQNRCLANTH